MAPRFRQSGTCCLLPASSKKAATRRPWELCFVKKRKTAMIGKTDQIQWRIQEGTVDKSKHAVSAAITTILLARLIALSLLFLLCCLLLPAASRADSPTEQVR